MTHHTADQESMFNDPPSMRNIQVEDQASGTTVAIATPADWREYYLANVRLLDRDKCLLAVVFLKTIISDNAMAAIRVCAETDRLWWFRHHFDWGLQVRTALCDGGFTTEHFGVANLGEYYIGLVELACGITEL